jgi:hypothetical protein
VSSWYFGDGTKLFNAAADRVLPAEGLALPIPKIIPLDPVLTSSVAKPGGAAFGFRVSRRITRRAAAEFSIERAGKLFISDQGLSRIDASRSSFAAAFGSVTGVAANSRSTIKEQGVPFTFSTGALTINTSGFGRIRPFLTVGAGLLSTGGETPNASLVGSYDPGPRANIPSDVVTDTIKLDFAPSNHQSFAALLGGGIKVPMNSRWGIRVDIRAYLYRNPITTSLTAVHSTAQTVAFIVADDVGFQQFWAVIPIGSPVGSPTPPGPVSSLSGPAIFGHKSFTETGLQSQIRISVGPYWRF